MIAKIIGASLQNRLIVLLIAGGIFIWGLISMQASTMDAIPDLSENQVIVYTEWAGRSPQLVEDQVTFPLITQLQGLSAVKTVRGTSMFGMSFIYVIFEDQENLYQARQRVQERLNTVSNVLPSDVAPSLGPDGTGVGHILWYTLEASEMDLGEQRALQDWYIRFALQNVRGVSEVASFGGFEKQYQILVDPSKLIHYGVSIQEVITAVRSNNNETGGSKLEQSEIGYIIKTSGYLRSEDDIENITVRSIGGAPVRVRNLGTVQTSSLPRTGIVDYNGTGEAVGGIIVMRQGENVNTVIERVKAKMLEVGKGLPDGVHFNIVYDRSELITESVASIRQTLVEEMVVVSMIVFLFLLHWRSAVSILIQIPISIAASFILLNAFDISSNIMSLTGIALAIGVIVDNGIIMSENAYRNLALQQEKLTDSKQRLEIVRRSSVQVSRGVFFSTIIIVAAFLPVFLLTGQEGKLFHPLAWTKTFILVIDAILAITLAPVLLSVMMKGKFRPDDRNAVMRALEKIYAPILRGVLSWRKTTIGVNLIALIISIPLLFYSGTEFMPPLDEQSILFMPVTLPSISNTEVKRILQVQDKIIATLPEVDKVLGKAGRASTATDNSPLSMIETIVLLKPKSEWRPGMTKESIIQELDAKLRIPGVINGWTQPIINRINMLSTGIRTDVGVKVYGQHLDTINAISQRIKASLSKIEGVHDLYIETITGGKYLIIEINRDQIGRYGLTVDDVNEVVEAAIGGATLTKTVEGRRRFSVAIRLPQDDRSSVEMIKRIPVAVEGRSSVPLSAVADVRFEDGPAMINSENASLRGAVLFNVRGRDLGSAVKQAIDVTNQELGALPGGYYLEWSGQYENLVHGMNRLLLVTPVVLIVILFSLFMAFGSMREAVLSLLTIPFALVGGVFCIYLTDVNLSVAVAVGFIALFGIAVETGIVMVIYLNDAMDNLIRTKGNSSASITRQDLFDAVVNGATLRLRPKLMTVCIAILGLIPVLWSHGVGSDVMRPIVLPMIGGMITSSTHILLVTPLIFLMTKEYELRKLGYIPTRGNSELTTKSK